MRVLPILGFIIYTIFVSSLDPPQVVTIEIANRERGQGFKHES